jgi:hypothetical protein
MMSPLARVFLALVVVLGLGYRRLARVGGDSAAALRWSVVAMRW